MHGKFSSTPQALVLLTRSTKPPSPFRLSPNGLGLFVCFVAYDPQRLPMLSFSCVSAPATTANTKGHDSPDTRGAFCRCTAKHSNRWVFNEFSRRASIATTAKPASPRQAKRVPYRLCSGFGFVGLGPTRHKHRPAVFVSGAPARRRGLRVSRWSPRHRQAPTVQRLQLRVPLVPLDPLER